ncbi:Putative aliphatic sulfonates transport permease protein SsuC [Rhodobacteraceae bacterium THAF1]|uniref:ABC transporter permease n=1 Tax=Palleronia sp. THAF1 TaxID=2587842 RepID=UPI000F3B75B1|nr:ABC transporter permease [Palleronia sp. THAF1]QFU09104.1 Putative aliphatic sulfonates transport permease protein SsuC [Palleronia sp. THAF1]VDC24088.1 Putative aliphatic sulfonates transport permease protein SsuC [Rhodobacteraceae bacterium THAF1]
MTNPRDPDAQTLILSLVGLVGLWVFAAWLSADPEILPGPWEVAQIAAAEASTGELWFHMGWTLFRVVMGFSIAMAVGMIIGLALGLVPALNRWFGPWVVVALNVPALVVIVLCYLWIGLNEVAAITAICVNKSAMVAVNIREGVWALDPKLTDMSRAFRMSRGARLAHVIMPQLWPFVAASTRNGLAIIWKIVLVVEFLGRSNGVGFQIHLYFQLFEVGYVLAYSLSFVGVMLAIEYLILQQWERRTTHWRRTVVAG